MRHRLDALVDRVFPGMGFRPLWIASAAAILLTLYEYHGSTTDVPSSFAAWSARTFAVEAPAFHGHLWSHCAAVVLLMLAPLVLSFTLEGWGPLQLGLGVRGAGRELGVVLLLWLAMLPVLALVHDTPAFHRTYPRLPEAATDVRLFLLYEGLYLVKWVAWEFFFRGFLLFGFARDFLYRAVLLSTVPFVLMHFGKPELETLGALVAGLILCFIALRSRSIWPGVLLHWLVATSLDGFASTWWR
ncbi:MAG: type II CAAX prenyl endopeptidase Rce1 family protein [Sandaracinaceae bacterium]